jgi:hypothetical protein
MAKFSISLILVFCLVGAGVAWLNSRDKLEKRNATNMVHESKTELKKQGMVVWTTTDIKENTKITKEMIVVKPMAEDLISDSDVGLSRLVIGQRPNHDLHEGQIINDSDIIDFPWERVSSVYLIHDVFPGAQIRKEYVYEVPDSLFNRAVESGPSNCATVIGKKARIFLQGRHHRITFQDLSQ